MTKTSISNDMQHTAVGASKKIYALMMAIWQRWGEPKAAFERESDLYRARFVSACLLSLFLVVGVILPFRYILLPIDDQTFLRSIITFLAGLFVFFAQRFAYRGRYMVASWMAILTATTAVTTAAIFLTTRIDTLYFYLIVPIFASAIMPVRRLIDITIFHAGIMLVIAAVIEPERGQRILEEPFVNFLILSFILIVIVTYRNYVERQSWDRIRESEKRHRVVTELISDYAYSMRYDKNGNVYFEWMTDSFERFTGQPLHNENRVSHVLPSFAHPDDQERLLQSQKLAFMGQTNVEEARYYRPDGTFGWVEIHRKPELDPETGEVIRVYGVGRDITARKESEAQVEVIALQKGRLRLTQEFVHAISHDFRTSLSNIETNRYLVERKITKHPEVDLSTNLDIIQLYIARMTRQLDGLADIADITDIVMQETSLATLFNTIKLLYSTNANAKHIQLITTLPEHDVLLWLDRSKVQIAMQRLIENSLVYTGAGGHIVLEMVDTVESTIIRVTDDGEGIAPEHIPYIFDLFYRGDMSRDVHTGGIGIGLSLVRFVMQAHNGDVTVTSTIGQGASFDLIFPKAHIRSRITELPDKSSVIH